MPFPLKANLVHVNVNGGNVFIATLDAVVLQVTEESMAGADTGLQQAQLLLGHLLHGLK